VRFTPLTISLEELSRLWSVLLQVQYVLSVAYKASVVLVERQLTPQPVLPARAINLSAIPLRQPFIRQIVADAGEDLPITSGAAIRIVGADLQGLATQVAIDNAQANTTAVTGDHITLNLPAALSAGPHRVQVLQGVQFDPASTPRLALKSNLGVFVLHPSITQTAGQPDIVISNVQGAGNAPRSAVVTIGVAPAVAQSQMLTLELLKLQQVLFTFAAAPRTDAAASLVFPISGVPAGDYPGDRSDAQCAAGRAYLPRQQCAAGSE
jgi:hypothetical protein